MVQHRTQSWRLAGQLAEKIWTVIDLVGWKSPIEEYEALGAKQRGWRMNDENSGLASSGQLQSANAMW
jgi:hypothetical protein